MKKSFLLSALIFGFSISASAANLPDPATCGKQLGQVQIKHSPSLLFLGTYTTKMMFTRAGQLSWSTNFGLDLKNETIDATKMSVDSDYNILRPVKFSCSKKPEACAIHLYKTLESLDKIVSQTFSSGHNKLNEINAMNCARSIILTTAQRGLTRSMNLIDAPLKPLSLQQASQVQQRMAALTNLYEEAEDQKRKEQVLEASR